jgi:hypothetical protein
MTMDGLALPVDPLVIANLNNFELRHQLRSLDLTDEQIAAAEAAVALVQQGAYPTHPADATAARKKEVAP